MNSIYPISLDLHKTSAPISLSVKQGDTGREIHISLTDGSTPYKIPDGSYAVFAGTKPDNKVLWNSCTIKDNTIIYEMTEQTVVVVGWIPVQIRLYSAGGKLLTSPDFVLIVDEPAVADGTIVAVSDNEITALTQLVTECTALKADLEEFKTGGYYTPVVTQPDENTLQIDFTPSSEDMPAVGPAKVTLPGGSGNDSTQNAALTTAQINALDGMFKVCAFTKDDVSAEYTAFKTAFGITDSGDTHSHSYTSSVTTAATCETAGVRTYTCSCGNSYTEEIPATGHNYVDGVCTVCGAADPDYNPEVTLSSISVTYNGGDVAVGTALTDLTGIVVTAHYSDGTSEAVAGYTLSGTIAEGSNTVTVTYQGMTTAFAVTGVAESGGDDVATWTSGVPYDKNVIDGEYVAQTDGSITKYSGWARTDYLNCYGASKVAWSGVTYNSTYNAFYDGDKSFISSFKTQTSEESEIEVPTNAVYVVFSATSDSVNRMVITPYE